MSQDLITKVKHVREEAITMASAAARIAQMASEVLDHGGLLQVHTQMHYLVGAMARMQQDIGVVNYKQQAGAVVRPSKRGNQHGVDSR